MPALWITPSKQRSLLTWSATVLAPAMVERSPVTAPRKRLGGDDCPRYGFSAPHLGSDGNPLLRPRATASVRRPAAGLRVSAPRVSGQPHGSLPPTSSRM